MLGVRGRRNLDAGEEAVADADVRAALRRRALRLVATCALLTAVVVAALLLL